MNEFYVYREEFGSVWKGGYYVEVSYITYAEDYYRFDEAYERWQELISEEVDADIYDNGFEFIDGQIHTPYADFDRTKYIGSGYRIGICVGEPRGISYEGYW